MKTLIAPSILSADFGRLNQEIAEVEPFCDRIHVDVMDGHFVPNISFGAPVMKWIKTALALDVHLMIYHPWDFFDDFMEAGASTIIVHQEVCGEYEGGLMAVLKLLGEKGAGRGVSIKPDTTVDLLSGVLDAGLVDQVLVMTVQPGFGGQKFMPDMLKKVQELRKKGFNGDIGIDGGVNAETAKICIEAGANLLIAGSYIFQSPDRRARIQSLKIQS